MMTFFAASEDLLFGLINGEAGGGCRKCDGHVVGAHRHLGEVDPGHRVAISIAFENGACVRMVHGQGNPVGRKARYIVVADAANVFGDHDADACCSSMCGCGGMGHPGEGRGHHHADDKDQKSCALPDLAGTRNYLFGFHFPGV